MINFIILLLVVVFIWFLIAHIDKSSNKTTSIAACPYCGVILNKIPKRKTKCPECKEYIYVRSKQTLFSSHFLTKEDAVAVDAMRELAGFGIDKNHYSRKKANLSKKFGQEPNSQDVIWGLYNNLISKVQDYNEASMIYYSMALFLNKLGKPYFSVLKQSRKAELKGINKRIIKAVRIQNSGDSCEACKTIDAKIFTVEQALKEMPLPCKECTYSLQGGKPGFCRCYYELIIDED